MDAKFEKYDSAFLSILQNEGEIMNFLEAFFSFLYKRTDFFVHLLSPTGKLGFRPGVAKKMILEVFKRYENLAAEQNNFLLKQFQSSNESKLNENLFMPQVASEVIIDNSDKKQNDVNLSCSMNPKIDHINSGALEINDSEMINQNLAKDIDNANNSSCQARTATESDVNRVSNNEGKISTNNHENNAKTDEEKDTNEQKIFQMNSESYNGAIRENYSWSQNIKEIDVYIKVPPHIRFGRQVVVKIEKRRLYVSHIDNIGKSQMLKIDDELNWEINKEESMWTLTPSQHIHINLEKIEERWWEHLIISEIKINVKKIDASRPITDLDDEAQSKIDELMYNDHQKKLGLPQSHEKKIQDILKTAWDVEGSPFKGQPYDPSIVNIQNNPM